MEKKALLALVLSLFILVGYQFIMSKLYPQRPIAIQQVGPAREEAIKPAQETIQQISQPEETQPILPTEKEINFQNNLYKITFTDVGAAIKNVTLNKNTKDGLNIPYTIFTSKTSDENLYLFFPDKFGASLNNVQYDVTKFDDGVIFTHNFNDGLSIEKKFTFYNSLYRIDLDITIRNIRDAEVTKKYAIISGVHPPASPDEERFLEISSIINGKILKYKKRSKPFDIQTGGIPNWVILKNRYFSIIMKPFIASSGHFIQQKQNGTLLTGLNIQEFNIPPSSSVIHKFGLYLGPSSLNLLKESNIGVESALKYGFFGSISQLLIDALKFFHKIVRNWGIAILVLTLVINIVLMPLTLKSYKSMHDMQMLQPKIEKIRQELKNNPQKLQKEIMELYKKHKVNPMGGCLPLLLQMPIFIALYQGLMGSLDLRGAKFLWINDLSVQENINIPFTLPLVGNHINILPILMIVATFFQQRISNKVMSISQTDEQRKQQKMTSIMMTVMMGFIFYSFPSGLVLYWLGNTIVMTVYQMVFTRTPRPIEDNA